MEETNYHRELSPTRTEGKFRAEPPSETPRADSKAIKKKTSYWSKLKLFDTNVSRYPNHLKGMVLRPLIFLSFPVIFYSGFSYGSNLIWFNVLNGTASLILSKKPYGFSSSIVGLCYFSPLIGVILGSVKIRIMSMWSLSCLPRSGLSTVVGWEIGWSLN